MTFLPRNFPKELFLLLTTACCALLLGAGPAHASGVFPVQISQTGDTNLDCGQISSEVSSMNALVSRARKIERDTEMTNTGLGVAKTVGSFLIGSLGGALGILAAGHFASEVTDEKIDAALAAENSAKQRISLMSGIFDTKGCQGPLQAALDLPAGGDGNPAAIEPAAGEEHAGIQPVKPRYSYND